MAKFFDFASGEIDDILEGEFSDEGLNAHFYHKNCNFKIESSKVEEELSISAGINNESEEAQR